MMVDFDIQMQAKFVDKSNKNRVAQQPPHARALTHITPDMYTQAGQISILNMPVTEDEVEAVAKAKAKAKAQAKRPPEPKGPPPTPSEGSGREQRVQQRRGQSQSSQGGYANRGRWRDDLYCRTYRSTR